MSGRGDPWRPQAEPVLPAPLQRLCSGDGREEKQAVPVVWGKGHASTAQVGQGSSKVTEEKVSQISSLGLLGERAFFLLEYRTRLVTSCFFRALLYSSSLDNAAS